VPPDDNETKKERELPPRVERALAKARAKAKEGKDEKRDNRGRWLALVPVSIALIGYSLFVPRATEPQAVPLPYVDTGALGATEKRDDALAAEAEANRLPTDVLAVGSALRAMNLLMTTSPKDEEINAARLTLDNAIRAASERSDALEKFLALRAIQLKKFLDEVERYEKTGEVTKELSEVGGGFVARNTAVGWIEGKRVHLTSSQRRVAYKMVWNAMTNLDRSPTFAPTIDEQRSLYALYLTRPHAPEQRRAEFDAERKAAKNPADCQRAAFNERRAVELWRAEKIQRLGQIDPGYPTAYALGVAYYRAGRFDLSSDAFRAYIDAHPDGPFVVRARNHLKAALDAYHSI
jgi:TolA-binding protein